MTVCSAVDICAATAVVRTPNRTAQHKQAYVLIYFQQMHTVSNMYNVGYHLSHHITHSATQTTNRVPSTNRVPYPDSSDQPVAACKHERHIGSSA